MVPHRAHDYRWLEQRWRILARERHWEIESLGEFSGYAVLAIRTFVQQEKDRPLVLISAGIHGDEPAGPAALFHFSAQAPEWFEQFHFVMLPCLNPWGLVNNSRFDEQGIDLNRCFHQKRHPFIRAWKQLMQRCGPFDLAITLHEDYDGEGIYLYELVKGRWKWGEKLMASAAKIIPVESRKIVDGRRQRAGLLRPRMDLPRLAAMGHPEAVALFLEYSSRVYTFETPSEWDLGRRVAAHRCFMRSALHLLRQETGS